jgi:REP element-mobilizing transposase RayT
MARKLRFVPQNPTLVSITNRTVQGRYLLRPGLVLNDRLLGILGKFQRIHGVQVVMITVLSNHFHTLLVVEDALQQSNFMRDVQSALSREVNRLTGWRGPVFERRFEATPVTNEAKAQVERLRYGLSNGVKEDLVEKVLDWPGVSTAAALLQGKPLKGHWIDRTQQHAARNRGEDASDERFAVEETLILSPLPCWAHLSPECYRKRIEALVEEVEAEAALTRRRSGSRVLGVKAILAQDPQTRPSRLARSPAPLVHAATKAARRMFYELYAEFVSAFRTAAESLRRGNRDAPFPAGSFPPALPFVAG